MAIVDAISSRWGTERLDHHMKVWFELDKLNSTPFRP